MEQCGILVADFNMTHIDRKDGIKNMARLWGILKKKNRIWRDIVVEIHGDDSEATQDALSDVCYALDIPRPIWLDKHEREWEEFGQTRFLPDDFLESVDFQRMEIEFIDPDAKKKKSTDYRNAF